MRARWRHAVKLNPVSRTKRGLKQRALTAAQCAHRSRSRTSGGSAGSAISVRLDRDAVPTVGHVMAALGKLDIVPGEMDDAQVRAVNAHYEQAVRNDLY